MTDAKKASYGAEAPHSLVAKCAQEAMRNAIGSMIVDDLMRKRDIIAAGVLREVNEKAGTCGMECISYVVDDITVPEHIKKELERAVTSQKQRLETVKASEGEREAAINKAEGLKRAAELESEGKKIAEINAAEGAAKAKIIRARADAEAIEVEAGAQAEALNKIGQAARGNSEAVTIRVAEEALKTWTGMLGKGNTIVTSPGTSSIESLLLQALSTYSNARKGVKETLQEKEAEKAPQVP